MRSKFVPLTLKLFTINAYPRFTICVKFPLPLSLYVFLVGWIIILSVLQASVWGVIQALVQGHKAVKVQTRI